jgi:hypothetical protein
MSYTNDLAMVQVSEMAFSVMLARQRRQGKYDTERAHRDAIKFTRKNWRRNSKKIQTLFREYEQLERNGK